jgi:hypothetical protein
MACAGLKGTKKIFNVKYGAWVLLGYRGMLMEVK